MVMPHTLLRTQLGLSSVLVVDECFEALPAAKVIQVDEYETYRESLAAAQEE